MEGKRILIIDDDPEVLDALATILEISGYSIDTASNTKDGFGKFEANHPDLVIVDIVLNTRTEGLEFASALKKKEGASDIPIVLISGGYTSSSLESEYQRSGGGNADLIPADVYMEKPLDPEGLIENVKQLLREN